MTDRQVYERALAEIQRCQERVDELRAFVRVYEEFAGQAVTKRVGRTDLPTEQNRASGEMQDWERMAAEAIRQAGRPLRVRDIYDAVVSMGYRIHSERPVDVLGTRINRSLHFRKADRGLYTVAVGIADEEATALDKRVISADSQADDEDRTSHHNRGGAVTAELPHSWERAAKGA